MNETIKDFYDLQAWKCGHELVLCVYQETKKFPKEELFGVTSQMRRAVCSITANIAEGFSRYHYKDKIKFYIQARGSVAELQNFLFVCRDLGYILVDVCQSLMEQSFLVAKLINGMVRSIENQITSY